MTKRPDSNHRTAPGILDSIACKIRGKSAGPAEIEQLRAVIRYLESLP